MTGDNPAIKTYFAPAKRKSDKEIAGEIDFIANNSLITQLLKSAGGLLAILNEDRQIVAINDHLLEVLDIKEASPLLGLRPGEALNCVYSDEMPGGCGTSITCSTCGAAISIMAALGDNSPSEKDCLISAEKNGVQVDYYFQIKSSPVSFGGKKFILFFINDITKMKQKELLERVFFHDINNIITSLVTSTYLLDSKGKDDYERLSSKIKKISMRLSREIDLQRLLNQHIDDNYQLMIESIEITNLVDELSEMVNSQPCSQDKEFVCQKSCESKYFYSDPFLLNRILTNMLLNALEATEKGGKVEFHYHIGQDEVEFAVWNACVIPDSIKERVFKKNFTTKNKPGRGMGTFSMKLFGEKYLKGKVDFVSIKDSGTTFRLRIPNKK